MQNDSPVTRRQANAALLAAGALAAAPLAALAAEPKVLPPPRKDIGRALMSALAARRSTREYSTRPLSEQVLSDLLWAAYGINRPSGDRTAPYWRHIMVVDIYAAMADGVWLYDPQRHALQPHLGSDIRALTGRQDFVATAPLNLVYVVHGERMTDVPPDERRLYGSVDAAFAGQNVYLYCASEGLATVFRGAVDTVKLGEALRLPDGQFVVFAQSVGQPKA
ncbi:MAG TPA: nitroreductase family protein [Casimicrobiaceae bacterium]|nr:nitroreductase family protein [Casimicrobiaceae bacterium]